MKRYIGIRCIDGTRRVDVVLEGRRFRVRALRPDRSLKLLEHSRDGFEWGYAGSGPAQLALAILLDYMACPQIALRFHQEFKSRFIAQLPQRRWEIQGAQIRDFVASELAKSRIRLVAEIIANCEETSSAAVQPAGGGMNIFHGFGSNR